MGIGSPSKGPLLAIGYRHATRRTQRNKYKFLALCPLRPPWLTHFFLAIFAYLGELGGSEFSQVEENRRLCLSIFTPGSEHSGDPDLPPY